MHYQYAKGIMNTAIDNEPGKLSTGEDATLGNYLKLSTRVFGAESRAVEYLQGLIEKDPDKENGRVLQEESQQLLLLAHLHTCGLMDCADRLGSNAGSNVGTAPC